MTSAEFGIPELLQEKLEGLPASPGCYIFRDVHGNALYIGKAKSLRSRVRSYFQPGNSDDRAFLPLLQAQTADFETVVVRTEKEAAVLENSLIKEYRPRYNVKLRDDKEFLSLRLNRAASYPRLELVRKPHADGARYFGPYHSATAARRTLHLVEKHFLLRTCTDREMGSRSRPCLQHQIGRCLAPCVLQVSTDDYNVQVDTVLLFLEGRHDELLAQLRERMAEASAQLNFELAGSYRDQLRAVESVRERQSVVSVTDKDQDVLGLYREGDLVELAVLQVRSGRVVEVVHYSSRVEVPDEEVVAGFLTTHYQLDVVSGAHPVIPDEILLPVLPEASDGISEWLDEHRGTGGSRCRLLTPQRSERRQLLELAMENAKHAFQEKKRARDDMSERLVRLQKRLRLPQVPRRIECVDISHLGGADTVGGVVALQDGQFDKSRFRTYKLREVQPGDDYAAMFQVLSRRFRRGMAAVKTTAEVPTLDGETHPGEGNAEVSEEWSLPDLMVVDGGRGQLAVALAAAADLGLKSLPIVGLAKERELTSGNTVVDRVYLPGQKNAVPLRPNSPELYLLAKARDEAHRFSNRGRKIVGEKRRFESALDSIRGIGPKTRTALLQTLGSVRAIARASDAELKAVPGITKRHITLLREHLPFPSTAEDPPPGETNE